MSEQTLSTIEPGNEEQPAQETGGPDSETINHRQPFFVKKAQKLLRLKSSIRAGNLTSPSEF
jgi:hypothetical protein